MRTRVAKRKFAQKHQERRKSERRGMAERREMVRWEPDKPERRKKRDRRKSATASWDDAYTRRR